MALKIVGEANRIPHFFLPGLGTAGLMIVLAATLWQTARARDARKAAIEANAAKSDFLANMSHELRTPLNGIVGMADLLCGTRLESDQREMAIVIKSSSECLVAMVNHILDFSRIESHGVQLETAELDLRALLDSTVQLSEPQAHAKGLDVEYSVSREIPPLVMGDPLRIQQILSALLGNAVKFTEAGGIRVELSRTGDGAKTSGLLFRVIDTGIGIHPRQIEKIFRPFTQVDSTTTRKYGGVGLGLALAHRLVSLMGGSINVESQPGRGSTFWFLLPLIEPSRRSHQGPAADGPLLRRTASTGERILIVEDNPVNQIVALRAVNSLGYAAELVSGGEQALDAIAGDRFAAILMDCQMPGLDGYQCAGEIRRRENQSGTIRTPIIAMTANAEEGDPERCQAAGMDDYLSKPIRLATLSRALERWTQIPLKAAAPSSSLAPASTRLPGRPSGHLPIARPEASLPG